MKSAILTLFIHGTFWGYPLASGGLANVLGMAAWVMVTGSVVLMLSALLLSVDEQPSGTPKWMKMIIRTSIFGAVVWLAWWGHVALAMAVLSVIALATIKLLVDKGAA